MEFMPVKSEPADAFCAGWLLKHGPRRPLAVSDRVSQTVPSAIRTAGRTFRLVVGSTLLKDIAGVMFVPVFGRGRFAGGADVVGPGVLEDALGVGDFIRVLGMNREQDVARLDLAFVAFGFELGNAQPDQPAGDATHGGAYCGSTERRQNRPGGNERSDAWNSQRAKPRQPAKRATYHAACARSGGDSCRRFGVFLMGEVTGRALVREQDGDVIVRKAGVFQFFHDLFCLAASGRDAEYGFL